MTKTESPDVLSTEQLSTVSGAAARTFWNPHVPHPRPWPSPHTWPAPSPGWDLRRWPRWPSIGQPRPRILF
jgi:hypothetical protein